MEVIKEGVKDLKIGFMPSIGFGPKPDDEVIKLCSEAVKLFENMGNQVAEIKPPFSQEDITKGENFYRTRTLAELDLLPSEIQAKGEVINSLAQKSKCYTGVDH